MNSPERQILKGREAYARKAWKAAHDALAAARANAPLEPEDLWRLALASFLVGEDGDFVRAMTDAHQTCVDRDDAAGALRYAFWLGMHLINRDEVAQGTGWLGRAGRLLESCGQDCVERGYMLIPRAFQQLGSGELEACATTAGEAAAIAQRFREGELLALALHLQGRARIRLGRVQEGLGLLDEAMVPAATGELSPLVTGLTYCAVISACREVYALRRVHEWTEALTDWCAGQPDMVTYNGECRLYRSEIMELHGEWQDALDEARAAEACFSRNPQPGALGLALYRKGEVLRLRGELAEAEEAYRAASRAGREPQPGLSLLRLAQGRADAAASALRRALGETGDSLRRARLLPAYVEIMLEVGALDEAREAGAELAAIADAYESTVLDALVDHARGAIELADGNPTEALAPLRRASKAWQALGAPRDAALARSLLGLACRALGDQDGAALELDAARSGLERLGASSDLRRLEERTARGREGTGRQAHGLTPREREVLALVATGATNREIAKRLFISDKTVARHVANLFRKLGVSSRAAATAFAYEHDLLDGGST